MTKYDELKKRHEEQLARVSKVIQLPTATGQPPVFPSMREPVVPTWTPVTEALPDAMLRVLVVVRNAKMRTITRAYYVPAHTVCGDTYEGDDVEYDETTDDYYWPEGWYESVLEAEIDFRLSGTVTHWMPLPNLPEVQP